VFTSRLLAVLVAVLAVIEAKDPLNCQITSNRGVGTICDFRSINAFFKDTTRLSATPTVSSGQIIDQNYVRSVRFDRSIFSRIPNVIFAYFPTVWDMKFGTGRVTAITRGDFRNAGDLLHVEFFNTKIDELLPRGFDGASNLREISFRQCKIGFISSEAFAEIPNLKRIKFSGSRFDVDRMSRAIPKSVEMVIMPS
jgi:hypothetical protein